MAAQSSSLAPAQGGPTSTPDAALRAPHGGPEMLGWAADTVARALSACGHTGGVQIRVW